MAFGATLFGFTIRHILAVPELDAGFSRSARIGLPDVAELATYDLHADVLGSAWVLDGIAARLARSQPGGVTGWQTGGRLVEAKRMTAVSETILVFAGISVALTHKPVAATRHAGTQPGAYVRTDFGFCAVAGAGGIALRLDADA